MSDKTERTGVVIVGAGFTGLSAAIELKRAGVDFVLVEARDRVGGRVEAVRNGLGERIDSGGQFLCEDMPQLMELARAQDKTFVETYVEGDFITHPAMSAPRAERTYHASMAIRERMNRIEPNDPAIEGLTVADWLEGQNDTADAKAAFRSMIEGLWCLALEKVPLWYLIDNDRRITNEVPELQYSLRETMQSVADDLARDFDGRVRLGEPVTRIEYGPPGVRVVSSNGVIEARAVLVAVPPATAAKLDFTPVLPAALDRALGAWESGAVIKILVRYPRPFWRERDLSGMVMWRDLPGLFACDASKDPDHAALVVFAGGPLALRWHELGEADLRAQVTMRLVEALGPEAADSLDFSRRDWTHDGWSGGAYSDLIIDVTARDAERTILAGAPPLHFASSELSPSFPGYVEGAIVAGRIAARRIIADVQSAIATRASGS
ncbi:MULTISPECIES: flavin monoamine oxidase family protein [unclassified Mesorhizobium]|uniref:flavin monoamine oxidase family protein n=1 Tax=unclassified Mesorhizobium TaxID=325217 RepID=UPI0010923791|nr:MULTISPECIES: flavin monoamine oxidase family protein [unclassified Mesorhizobium]TIT63241.1 MAG: flavin monoamine oxidase family protein [Mesorhizobium sp.]TGP98150.1 flavin monoamine oxidase family protein [Mesorhizobium sp. M8A.F.Ca.ET.218.01.1.1]TGQ77939.1 flavin monoamine oxidase family protein [Mesorhizobium sp. M8A.F.Ca.ET.207.01.1.1]TGT19495.1 flavin monoamine oxidase family protein [Mesorhizobium sp. M8A.F.Ca.ET.213.01.1.1]TGT88484.1 flavin monoamine oxidase family protein [Mesorhi